MASKGYSGTSFWAKQIGLALVLIMVAAGLIYLEGGSDKPDDAAEKSVSKGLSDFYREFRQSSSAGNSASSEFVVDVERNEDGLDEQLKSRASKHRPVTDAWVGEHKFRSFKAGNTLREVISDYAEKEGMQVVWDLEQDFVIKHHFQVDDTLVGSLTQIASAVDSNFSGDVHAYVCADQRSLVVTARATEFLLEQCAKAN
ncbi:toxin co-regulated pilus biosynthesis Q family protein [Salinimonas marina]|uniref:Toxin co-regulated pilus biosynthesis Q family protein n=1 Tax=Salinimonas marina TaxID=2785918 RepID=A0A7S9DYL6_9ALTE|nr:TcpQ domain-containing protein [Salinimonas marina]QPG06372.1 toxin co-regulated pilus biosynthesis Q family protein [Salinimonas marina]